MLNRIDSLTHRDCGNQDVVAIAEWCLIRIESYTARLLGYKYPTVAVDCNSGVWAFLLRAFCPNISRSIYGIQPLYASLRSDLEHIGLHSRQRHEEEMTNEEKCKTSKLYHEGTCSQYKL